MFAVIAWALAGCGETGRSDADSDGDADSVPDEMEIHEGVDPSEVDGEFDSEQLLDPVEQDIVADEEEGEEEMVGPGCGDGILQGPEVCDDGNRMTEFCGRWGDCLGDCSLLEANCGNGRLDPGEECDDGNQINVGPEDYCTTSCNINDKGIGSPCECPNCFGINVTREPIYGCEGVQIPTGSGGMIACIHTLVEEYSGYRFYAPVGYCTIYALSCIGDEIDCEEVEDIGDIETFTCPPGYPHFGALCTGTGGIGIALKACMRPCDSPAQCQWNAYDESLGECGRMDCIRNENDPLQRVCFDARNFMLSLPDLECEFI